MDERRLDMTPEDIIVLAAQFGAEPASLAELVSTVFREKQEDPNKSIFITSGTYHPKRLGEYESLKLDLKDIPLKPGLKSLRWSRLICQYPFFIFDCDSTLTKEQKVCNLFVYSYRKKAHLKVIKAFEKTLSKCQTWNPNAVVESVKRPGLFSAVEIQTIMGWILIIRPKCTSLHIQWNHRGGPDYHTTDIKLASAGGNQITGFFHDDPKPSSVTLLPKVCAYCNQAANSRCACKTVYYCCKEHQKSDWNVHKPKCVVLE